MTAHRDSRHDPLSPEEQALAQRLAEWKVDEPDEALDRAILAQAQSALVTRRPDHRGHRRPWLLGVASAATFVFAVGLIWRVAERPAEPLAGMAREAAPASAPVAAADQGADSSLPAAAMRNEATPAADAETAAIPPPPPPVLERIGATAPSLADEFNAGRAETAQQGQTPRQPESRAGDRGRERVAPPMPTSPPSPPAPPPPMEAPAIAPTTAPAPPPPPPPPAATSPYPIGQAPAAAMSHEQRALDHADAAEPVPDPRTVAPGAGVDYSLRRQVVADPFPATERADDKARQERSAGVSEGAAEAEQLVGYRRDVERIRQLIADGRHQPALTAIDRLRKRHPDQPLPADLKAYREAAASEP